MNAKDEKKSPSASPKEKEKLKQRLQTLFKQHEQKARQKKTASKSSQKKNQNSKAPQQGNRNPEQVATEQNISKPQENSVKRTQSKKKQKNLNNGGVTGKVAHKTQTLTHKQNESDKNVQTKQKKFEKRNANIPNQPPSETSKQQNTMQKPTKKTKNQPEVKNKQHKAGQNSQIKNDIQLQSTEKTDRNKQQTTNVPLTNGLPKLTKNQKKNARKRAAATSLNNVSEEIKKPKLVHEEAIKKHKKANNNKVATSPSPLTQKGSNKKPKMVALQSKTKSSSPLDHKTTNKQSTKAKNNEAAFKCKPTAISPLVKEQSMKKPKRVKNNKTALQSKPTSPSTSKNINIGKVLAKKSPSGYVKGGDFDNNSDEDAEYWNHQLSQDDSFSDMESNDREENDMPNYYKNQDLLRHKRAQEDCSEEDDNSFGDESGEDINSYGDESGDDINSYDDETGEDINSNGDESEDDINSYGDEYGDDINSYGDESENDINSYGDESGDDPYNYSDLKDDELEIQNNIDEDELGDDPYDYSDLNEEEEEHYSDFDEDDYEEDEDSHDYSDDSEFSSDYDGNDGSENSYNFNDYGENDDDYKLPEHVAEDLVIHSGTATKRDLLPEDNVKFKNNKNSLQLFELKDQETVEVIHQRKEYTKEELLKLTYKENHDVKLATDSKSDEQMESPSPTTDKEECPKLVPIDGFQLYNPNDEDDEDIEEEYDIVNCGEEEEYSYDEDESLGSEYTELNSDDADSLLSEDINDKYLNRGKNYDDDCYTSEEEYTITAARKTADIIDATTCEYKVQKGKKPKIVTDSNKCKDIDQLPSQKLYRNVKVGSKSDVISTTVIDQDISNEDPHMGSENKVDAADSKREIEKSSDHSNNTIYTQEGMAEINIEPVFPQPQKLHESTQAAERLKTTSNALFYNAINANVVIVLLKDPFYIYGTVRLTLLAGTVEVYGHSLAKHKEVELFSPRGCSVIEISSNPSTAEQATSKDEVKNLLKNYESNFILCDLENIANRYEPEKDAIVLLQRNDERKKAVQQFKKFMNENVFPNLQNITMDRPLYSSEYLLRCMINTSAAETKCLRLPKQWQTLEVTSKSRVMLVGGKGVGKSTLLRYLINKQITSLCEKVLLIDLDIGQPEIFVPQTVSCSIVDKPLLGPGFFLNIQPEKSYVVGHTNIALCPHKYVDAVKSVIRYCMSQAKFENIPWFVNTMGYNKGFGPELISVIASELPLTDVIQLQSHRDINNFDRILLPSVVSQVPRNMFVDDVPIEDEENGNKLNYRLQIWRSAVEQESRYQKEWDMSPKDLRYAMLLTRLTEALRGHAEWLSDCKPMSAPLNQLKLINLTDDIPPCTPDEMAKAMEANLVYLCHYEDDSCSVECLGIGVVRAIDYHVQQIYLLPATSSLSLLKRVNCLALGEMPLPSSLFTNQGSRVQNTAPFVYNTVEAKASKAIKQIYHRPASFLKGKRKPQ